MNTIRTLPLCGVVFWAASALAQDGLDMSWNGDGTLLTAMSNYDVGAAVMTPTPSTICTG